MFSFGKSTCLRCLWSDAHEPTAASIATLSFSFLSLIVPRSHPVADQQHVSMGSGRTTRDEAVLAGSVLQLHPPLSTPTSSDSAKNNATAIQNENANAECRSPSEHNSPLRRAARSPCRCVTCSVPPPTPLLLRLRLTSATEFLHPIQNFVHLQRQLLCLR
jgi:hypothetical protein